MLVLWLSLGHYGSYGSDRHITADYLQRLDLDQAVIEKRRPPHVREDIATRQFVGILAVARELLPPHRQRDHDAATRAIGDPRAQLQAAAVIEDADIAAVDDPAACRVSRVNVEPRLPFAGAQALDVDETAS